MSDENTPSRPPVNITNAAMAGEWLRTNIGTRELSGYFARGDDIVHTPREGTEGYIPPDDSRDSDGPAQVRIANATHISATVNYSCWPYKRPDPSKPPAPARFATEIAKDATARPDMCPGLRPLRGVTHTPIVRADGSVLSAPGYDATSGYLYLPSPGLFVPALPLSTPTVSWAVGILSEMIADFPWRSVDDRCNYLGMLLTPLLRQLCPPPYKLGVVTAPQPASGKTLLVRIMHILHGGVFRSEIPRDDAELKKQITSILTGTTAPVVTFDNVSGTFRSSVLDGLLTSDIWTDRVLGATAETSRPNDRFWTITGNNVGIGGDLARRSLWASIDADRPDPENRPVAIGDLPGWVAMRRGGLLAALLLLVQAWRASGSPRMTVSSSDGFASWVSVVGGILANAGVPGAFASATTVQASAATDDAEWADLLATIRRLKGSTPWTARELLETREATPIDPANAMLGQSSTYPVVEALPTELAARAHRDGPASVARSFGMWLRNRAGRWAGGLTIRDEGVDGKGTVRWVVETHEQIVPASPGNDAYSSGTRDYQGPFMTQARRVQPYYSRAEWGKVPDSPLVPEVGLNGQAVNDMLMDERI